MIKRPVTVITGRTHRPRYPGRRYADGRWRLIHQDRVLAPGPPCPVTGTAYMSPLPPVTARWATSQPHPPDRPGSTLGGGRSACTLSHP